MVESAIILNNAANITEWTQYINTFEHRAELYNKAFTKLGLSKIKFCSEWATLPTDCIILLSGSPIFFNSICSSSFHDKIVVYIGNQHDTKRRRPGALSI